MKIGTMEDLRVHFEKIEAYKDKNYSVEKVLQYLGEEPWDTELVVFLYMQNFKSINTILSKHKGYTAYLNIQQLNTLFSRLQFSYEQILLEKEEATKKYFNTTYGEEILNNTQEKIGLYFYTYLSLCYAIIQLQTQITKKHIQNKPAISEYFKTILENPCHRCIILLRNKINHGSLLDFRWRASVDYKTKTREVIYKLDKDQLENIHPKDSKDREGYGYLISKKGILHSILIEHFSKIKNFIINVINLIQEENHEAIFQYNAYYTAIL